MNKRLIIIIIIIFSALVLAGGWYFFHNQARGVGDVQAEPIKKDRVVKIAIAENSTFGKLMTDFSDLDANTVNGLYETAKPVYDLAKIKAGKFLELIYDKKTDKFKEFIYKIDSEDQLRIYRNPDFKELELTVVEPGQTEPTEEASTDTEAIPLWLAVIEAIPYEVKIKTAEGTVETSMYEAALKNNIDERAIIALADVFQWTIDFAMDPRVDDIFKFIYEERYLDGEYIMPGRVLAGQYVNDGAVYDHYYFEESPENSGYFDRQGNSVQKMFLKAPVAFKYISSGYTTGRRVVMEIGLVGPHMAIDYAAPIGTPIRAVGDGTVTFTGWSGCYGNLTSVRHNGTYTTNYAHQSKFAVRAGQKVKQGDIIGYVGSTGCSTGPHVHFEMVKNGVKIDPLKEILPPGTPIKEENQERFFQAIADYQKELGD